MFYCSAQQLNTLYTVNRLFCLWFYLMIDLILNLITSFSSHSDIYNIKLISLKKLVGV